MTGFDDRSDVRQRLADKIPFQISQPTRSGGTGANSNTSFRHSTCAVRLHDRRDHRDGDHEIPACAQLQKNGRSIFPSPRQQHSRQNLIWPQQSLAVARDELGQRQSARTDGGGDGTFTPSYTLYDFQKQGVPDLAMDVDGDGRDDLVELDGENSSFHVIPSIPGPSFQLALGGDPVEGSTGSAFVTLAVSSSSPTVIALSASDPAISVPAKVTVPAGQASELFTFSVGSSFNPNHVFALMAELNGQTATAYGTQVKSGAKGFTVSSLFSDLVDGYVSTINLAAGQSSPSSGYYLVFAKSVNGYSGTLNLECIGLPGQSQCQIGPNTIPIPPGGGAQAEVVLSVPAGTAMGSYPFTLRATDGASKYNVPLTLNVGDFTIGIGPAVQQAMPTGTATYNLTLTSVDNYDGDVSITCAGLPNGAFCPNPYGSIPTPAGSASALPVSTQSVAVGNYPFTITGVSSPLTHSASATLQVWDFTPSVTPLSATVTAGDSATFDVSVASVNGYNGTATFWCQTPNGQITCSFNPASPTVPANGTATSALTITTSSQLGSHQRKPGRIFPATVLLFPVGAALIALVSDRKKWTGGFAVIGNPRRATFLRRRFFERRGRWRRWKILCDRRGSRFGKQHQDGRTNHSDCEVKSFGA